MRNTHKKTPKKKLRQYEVGIPVNEIWVYQVEATSFFEAVKMIRDGSNDKACVQTCSVSGGPSNRKPVLYKIRDVEEPKPKKKPSRYDPPF